MGGYSYISLTSVYVAVRGFLKYVLQRHSSATVALFPDLYKDYRVSGKLYFSFGGEGLLNPVNSRAHALCVSTTPEMVRHDCVMCVMIALYYEYVPHAHPHRYTIRSTAD